jgi:signal transduction histidine kinase
MKDSAVAECIRSNVQPITEDWQRALGAERLAVPRETQSELSKYLPEFLQRLADSAEAGEGRGCAAFLELARQHAQERLAAGCSLEDLSLEYALLRKVLLERFQKAAASASGSLYGLVCLNEALDHATELAVRCYDEQRSTRGERFVRLLGHDLRNPLNAASIAADALTRSEPLSPRGQKRLSTIARANARMGRLIENMLDFARSYFGGALPLLPEEGDWGEVCEGVFEEVRAENPDRQLLLTRTGNLAGRFDRERLRQAVLNMLTNALEYGKDPIALAVLEEERDDSHCIITRVTSQGETVTPGTLLNLDPLAEPKASGGSHARIGLYVTSLIARAHGAACEVSSASGETCFSVRWPRAIAA